MKTILCMILLLAVALVWTIPRPENHASESAAVAVQQNLVVEHHGISADSSDGTLYFKDDDTFSFKFSETKTERGDNKAALSGFV